MSASLSITEPTNSQGTESTATLSCSSQDSEANDEVTQTSASVECQTDEVIFMSKEDYEEFVYKATKNINIKGDLENLKTFFLTHDPHPPVMDPNQFKGICMEVGVTNLFSTLHDAMSSDQMSDDCQELTKLRVMVVKYIMMYSQSQ